MLDQTTKDAVFERSGGRCECYRAMHFHLGRCSNLLVEDWQPYQSISPEKGGVDLLYNWQGLCADCYHKVSAKPTKPAGNENLLPRLRRSMMGTAE